MEKQTLVVFDFDGTITKKDTFVKFIRFVRDNFMFFRVVFVYLPLLVLLYSNQRIKQKLLSFFFREMNLNAFNKKCEYFCENFQHLIKPRAVYTKSSHRKIVEISIL